MSNKKEVIWEGDSWIRTNGTDWQIRIVTTAYVHDHLKDHVKNMQSILKEHPDAYVSLENDPEDYGVTGNKAFVVRWWKDVEPDHKEVVKYLANNAEAERRQKESEEREIAALRARRPDLFK